VSSSVQENESEGGKVRGSRNGSKGFWRAKYNKDNININKQRNCTV